MVNPQDNNKTRHKTNKTKNMAAGQYKYSKTENPLLSYML